MECFNLYGYKPSNDGAIVGAVLWGVFSLCMIIPTVKCKAYYLLIVPLAGFSMYYVILISTTIYAITAEMVGYIARIFSAKDPCGLGLFIIQGIFILVPPTCLAMGNYTLLSRLYVLSLLFAVR